MRDRLARFFLVVSMLGVAELPAPSSAQTVYQNRPERFISGRISYFHRDRVEVDHRYRVSIHRGTYIVPLGMVLRRGQHVRIGGYLAADGTTLIANEIIVGPRRP